MDRIRIFGWRQDFCFQQRWCRWYIYLQLCPHNNTRNNKWGVYQRKQHVQTVDYEWTWDGSILGTTMFEWKKSGEHGLPNGNFIIAENHFGQVSEVSKNSTVLWTYKNPTGTGALQFMISLKPQERTIPFSEQKNTPAILLVLREKI